jgi:hypothetical protein
LARGIQKISRPYEEVCNMKLQIDEFPQDLARTSWLP